MDITIYEDQTGLMQFPDKRSEKDSKIVNFFNNNVDLYIDKIGNNITIYCHLIAFKASTRPLGYYIIGKDIYSDIVFANFKKDVDKILKNLELQPRTGHVDNTIFENIQRFDDKYQYYKEDINIIKETVNYGRNLEYSAGDIKDTSAFCKGILKNTNNIKISISSTKNNLGNINIIVDKKSSEPLKRTYSTEQIIREQRERLLEKKKAEEGAPGLSKIKDNFDRIKEGADILKNAGYSNSEIRNEINKKVNEIYITFPTDIERRVIERRIPERNGRVPIKIPEITNDDKDIYKDATRSSNTKIILIIGIVTILAIVMIFKIGVLKDMLPENIKERIGLATPTPTTTQMQTPTPTVIPEIQTYSSGAENLKIVNYSPNDDNISSIVGMSTTFSVVTNQSANITWYINDVEGQYNESVYNSTYINTSVVLGKWTINVTAVSANGTDSKQWNWTVTNR